MNRWGRNLLWVVFLAVGGAVASGQELEPRSYANTPVGVNFIVAGYGFASGSIAFDPAVPLEKAEVDAHSAYLAYARSFGAFGRSAKCDLVVPYAWLSGTADYAGQPRERNVSGFGDPRFRVGVNLFGAPALTLNQFKDYRQDWIVGMSVQVAAPLGQYDSSKLVNIGTHRWMFKPELGISKAIGPVTLEVATAASVFTDNDDFLSGKTLAQDPICSVQGHVIYSFGRGFWAAVDATYYAGGRTSIDGVKSDSELENVRLGLTVSFPVHRNHAVKLYANTGVVAATGTDFDSVGVAWQIRWGGGL